MKEIRIFIFKGFIKNRQFYDLLDHQEKMRFKALRKVSDKNLFLSGRILAKRVLGRLLGVEPASVRIFAGRNGRPFLRKKPCKEFDFNLSHSGACAAIITGTGPLGIDIEKIIPRKASPDLAVVFSKEERAYIKQGGRRAFFEIWTLKEAFFKAGVAKDLAGAKICFKNGKIAGFGRKDWKFSYFYFSGYCLAACWQGKKKPSLARLKEL